MNERRLPEVVFDVKRAPEQPGDREAGIFRAEITTSVAATNGRHEMGLDAMRDVQIWLMEEWKRGQRDGEVLGFVLGVSVSLLLLGLWLTISAVIL